MSAAGIRLEARALAAFYGKSPALRGLDAGFPAGDIVALLGENGSGKSTLLKVFARIVSPSSGEAFLDGLPLSGLPRRETARRIAYVPQSADLVFPIRSLDLVLQGRAPRARGFSADSPEDRRIAREAMAACDVAHLVDRDASALSGGERRRVFLARALAQEADIWLLDEPTAGLDPRHRFDFLAALMREHRTRGTTVILVTHEISLAAELADRVVVLAGGRAQASGTPSETLTPETIRRAFGVEARVDDVGGRPRVSMRAPTDAP
ncbi:MAG: ABC transporter ATP-binding protein, partial [Acidobacteriota bacterium]|nr:ABC transporter ATP-binding protein [Acidobacteriota bacterium]